MTDLDRLVRALLRQQFSAFHQKVFATLEPGTTYRHNWSHDHMACQSTRVARGDVRRLICAVPPRSGKSIMFSMAFPAWLLGHDPTTQSFIAKCKQGERRVDVIEFVELVRAMEGDPKRVFARLLTV